MKLFSFKAHHLRLLLSLVGIWRLLELIIFAYWVEGVSPFPLNEGGLNPLLGLSFAQIAITILGIASYALWAVKGSLWAIPALIFGAIPDAGYLPLGWGKLAIQPFILWVFLGDILPLRFIKFWRMGVFFQLAWIYFSSILGKNLEAWWQKSYALNWALRGDYIPTVIGHWIGEMTHPEVLQFLTRVTIILQILGVLLILIPFVRGVGKKVLLFIWSLLFFFHLGNMILFHLGAFGAATCLLLLLPFQVFSDDKISVGAVTKLIHLPLVLLVTSFALGISGTQNLELWRTGLVQNWAVMRVPERQGHFVFNLPDYPWSTDELDGRWKMALAFGLTLDKNSREVWFKIHCKSHSKVKAFFYHTSRPEIVTDLSSTCPEN